MNCSKPCFSVLHYLMEFTQTHVHWIRDTIQPSYPLLPPSSALNFSQGQGFFPMNQLFTTDGQSIVALASAPALPMNIEGWFHLGLTGLIILISKGLSRVLSSTKIQKHQFFSTQPSFCSNSYIHTWLLEKPKLWLYGPLSAKWCFCFLIYCLCLP